MTCFKGFIQNHYDQKNILLTGVTGFLGKVLLAMILDQLPNIGRIYVLIRKNKKQSAIRRFYQEILTSPALTEFSKKKQAEINQLLLDRVKVLEGDVTQSNFGLSNETFHYLHSHIDLIIHIAALVDFSPDLRSGLNANVYGSLNVAEFTKQCRKARLIHISTCYVAGNQSGLIQEQVIRGRSPNGMVFNEELELETITKQINQITTAQEPLANIKKKLKKLGCERAAYWGWSNTYCYTKAMAEYLLVSRYSSISLTIIRPSIIESAVLFPFPGWNEGLNGTAPLTIASTTKYRYVVANKQSIIDIIPVDFVSQAILVIGADVLNRGTSDVYQLATSNINPCFVSDYKKIIDQWCRNFLRKNLPFYPVRNFFSLKTVKCISPKNFFAPKNLISQLTAIYRLMNHLGEITFFDSFKNKLVNLIGKLQQIDKVYSVYQSFIFDHVPIFCSNKMNQLFFKENKFFNEINQLNWHDYLLHTHLPGLNKWIFSFIENKKPLTDTLPIVLHQQEQNILLKITNHANEHDGSLS